MRALLAAMVLLLTLVGCGGGQQRQPPPTVRVDVYSEYEYALDGERMNRALLEERLRRLADEHRRPIVNNSRVYMHVVGHGPGTGDEVQEVVSYCISVGLDKIRVGR